MIELLIHMLVNLGIGVVWFVVGIFFERTKAKSFLRKANINIYYDAKIDESAKEFVMTGTYSILHTYYKDAHAGKLLESVFKKPEISRNIARALH